MVEKNLYRNQLVALLKSIYADIEIEEIIRDFTALGLIEVKIGERIITPEELEESPYLVFGEKYAVDKETAKRLKKICEILDKMYELGVTK